MRGIFIFVCESPHMAAEWPGAIGKMSGTFAVAGCVSGRSGPRGWTLIRSSWDGDICIHIQISPSMSETIGER